MPRLVGIGLAPILFAAIAGAQQPTILTEAEYLSALDDSHPAVRESAEALARAVAAERAAATLENPTLEAIREDPSGPTRQLEVLLSWQLPHASRRAEIGARGRDVDAASARHEHARLTIRLAMRAVYAQWAVVTERHDRLAAQAARVEALARRERARSERGEASGLEARRLELAAAALRARVALAAAESHQARGAAAVWAPDLVPGRRPALPAVAETPELQSAHPVVRAAEADLAAAELARQAARRALSSPEISLGWQRQDIGRGTLDGPVLGLAWSVPLFDRRRAARSVADARLDATRARLELAVRRIGAKRIAAAASHAELIAALASARQKLEATERMLDGAEAAFRLGEASLTDLLETHRSVTEAELATLDLHRAALDAVRELERLAGPTRPAATPESHNSPAGPPLENLP